MGESPNVASVGSHEAKAGVSGATLPPKQADNGEEGTLVAPRPLCGPAGRNVSEAERSVVRVSPQQCGRRERRAFPFEAKAEPEVRNRQEDHLGAPRRTRPGTWGRASVERWETCLGPEGSGHRRPTRPANGACPRVRSGIRANPEARSDARTGVGGGRSSGEAPVMGVDAKGLYFGEATRGERGHPIRREA